jgi:hypothetical protein
MCTDAANFRVKSTPNNPLAADPHSSQYSAVALGSATFAILTVPCLYRENSFSWIMIYSKQNFCGTENRCAKYYIRPWSTGLIEHLRVAQLRNISYLIENPKFQCPVHKSEPMAHDQNPVHNTLPFSQYLLLILPSHLLLGLPRTFVPSDFPIKNLHVLRCSHACYVHRESRAASFQHADSVCRAVQIITVLSMQFPSLPCYFLPLL